MARRPPVGIRPEHIAVGAGPIRAPVDLDRAHGLGTHGASDAGRHGHQGLQPRAPAAVHRRPVQIDLPLSRLHLFDDCRGEGRRLNPERVRERLASLQSESAAPSNGEDGGRFLEDAWERGGSGAAGTGTGSQRSPGAA